MHRTSCCRTVPWRVWCVPTEPNMGSNSGHNKHNKSAYARANTRTATNALTDTPANEPTQRVRGQRSRILLRQSRCSVWRAPSPDLVQSGVSIGLLHALGPSSLARSSVLDITSEVSLAGLTPF